jgi:hypothetical protein
MHRHVKHTSFWSLSLRGLWAHFFVALFCSSLCAKSQRHTNALPPEDQRIVEWLQRKPESKTRIYDQVFQSADKEIQNHYDNTVAVGWNPVRPMGITSSALNMSNGSDAAIWEAKNREEFASYVVRVRMQRGIKNMVDMLRMDRNSAAVRSAQRAQRAMNSIRQQSVTVPSGGGGAPLVFSFGYDVVTDVSQIRCQKGSLSANLVHPKFLSAMTGSSGLTEAFFQFSASLGKTAPRAFLGFPLAGNSFDLGVAQSVTRGMDAELRFGAFPASGGTPAYESIRATVQLQAF